MSRVRVRLRAAHVRLSYDGGHELFERRIEPLLLGLARGGTRPAAPNRPTDRAAEVPAEPAAPEAVPVRPDYVPPAGSFGTFQRQLDPARDGPGQQVAGYAFFLWNYEKKEVFGEDEVLGCFAADEREPPEDVAGVCTDLEQRRILERVGDAGWRLTAKGLSRVRKSLR